MSTKNKQSVKFSLVFLLIVISINMMGFTKAPGYKEQARNQYTLMNNEELQWLLLDDHTFGFLEKTLTSKENKHENEPINEQKEQKVPVTVNSIQQEEKRQTFDLSNYEKVHVTATGYTAGKESTGKDKSHPQYGITYSGVRVIRDQFSTIAADLKVFPIGTILYIPGYGFGVVADKGSAIKGNKIDLYFETVQDVYNTWGKKKLDVYVIKKGNGKLTEEVMLEYNRAEPVDAIQ